MAIIHFEIKISKVSDKISLQQGIRALSVCLLLLFLLYSNQGLRAQTKILLDTDLGGDADDLGALAVLHHFIDQKECEVLGIMAWSTEKYTIEALDAINRYYGHPSIPIGTRKGPTSYIEWNYNKTLADLLPHQLQYDNALDATLLYRKILAANNDNSITLVVIGPLLNIQKVINSKPDSISPLSGKELLSQKVKQCVIMGGHYPTGKWEWNFSGDMPGVTRKAIKKLKTPIVFTGFEVGSAIQTGEAFNQLDPKTPLHAGYLHFNKNAPWKKKTFVGRIGKNSCFDQTAVLYAVQGAAKGYWEISEPGVCIPNRMGGNRWKSKKAGTHAYLKIKMNPDTLAMKIEHLMLKADKGFQKISD